jgi:uncharacterized membrane protein
MNTDEKIQLIGQKIFQLSNNLDRYRAELDALKNQLEALKAEKAAGEGIVYTPPVAPPPATRQEPVITEQIIAPIAEVKPVQQPLPPPRPPAPPKKPVNIEEYIGGNLIAKVGIVILVIGIAIGVKYAIDRDLIDHLTRIVLGYVAGGLILGFAFWLKKKYEAFSAVLLSGAMATLYFTTFAAYSFYHIFPQIPAFLIMVVFTAFTVFAATVYNQQWIGIFGLVGAYAVPMLLDENSGKVHIMFIYMTIINTGILILSFKKYWQILTHVSYALTWIIFSAWFVSRYDHELHSTTALIFSFVFFITFYLSFIAYKTIRKEKFNFRDILLVMLNSFIYFSIGYAIVSQIPYNAPDQGKYLGLFTLGNALVHLAFAYSVYINKQVDRKLFFLIMAMVLCFATIAVPVQLEGHWVTLFWSAEMFLLFWIGRTKGIRFYEGLSFAMILLAVISLMDDWSIYFAGIYDEQLISWMPFANITFLTSFITIASLGGIIWINRKYPLAATEWQTSWINGIAGHAVPVALAIVTYFAILFEIGNLFDARIVRTAIQLQQTDLNYPIPVYDTNLEHFKTLWQINFSLLYVFMLGLITKRYWRGPVVRWAIFSLELLSMLIFLTVGLYILSVLRDSYYNTYQEYFVAGPAHLYMRYICFVFFGLVMYNFYMRTREENALPVLRSIIVPVFHLCILIVLSSELTNMMVTGSGGDPDRVYASVSRRIGYTVLWGLYSFVLIALGIRKRNKVLRISAIVLFGLTLIKLFAFDIINLSTGYKVVAFTALGILLLVVSFLYQKFKTLIFGDDEPK